MGKLRNQLRKNELEHVYTDFLNRCSLITNPLEPHHYDTLLPPFIQLSKKLKQVKGHLNFSQYYEENGEMPFNSLNLYMITAHFLEKLGKYKEALDIYTAIISYYHQSNLGPQKDKIIQVVIWNCRNNTHYGDAAFTMTEQYLPNGKKQLMEARLYQEQGKWINAQTAFHLLPNSPAKWIGKGHCFQVSGNFHQAVKCHQEALKIPTNQNNGPDKAAARAWLDQHRFYLLARLKKGEAPEGNVPNELCRNGFQ